MSVQQIILPERYVLEPKLNKRIIEILPRFQSLEVRAGNVDRASPRRRIDQNATRHETSQKDTDAAAKNSQLIHVGRRGMP